MFLHDGLGAIEAWKEIPTRLCADGDVRAVVYDRWGHGGSAARARFEPGFMEAEVAVLMEVVDALGAGLEQHSAAARNVVPVDLVGHSDGATIALLAAAWYPDQIRSVVSIAAHTFVEPETTASIQALRDVMRRGASPTWVQRLHGNRGAALLEAWADVWLGQVHARWDVRAELSAIRCPVLALQGDGDEFGSDEQLAVIGKRIRGAEIWRLRGGHSPQHDATEEFVQRVGDFWRRGAQPD